MYKKEYPKMIYKEGTGNTKGEYRVVKTEIEHMMWLEIWGDKRPDSKLKNEAPLVKEKKSVDNEEKVAADNSAKEAKPRRKTRKKKV